MTFFNKLFASSAAAVAAVLLGLFLLPAPAAADAPICSLPNANIPDYAEPPLILTDTLTISSSTLITDMNVVISTTHTYVGDLVFTLTHRIDAATATTVTLISRPLLGQSKLQHEVSCTGDDIFTTLDDEGLLSIQTDCQEGSWEGDGTQAYFTGGTYTPAEPLSGFDGQVISGTWELTVRDYFREDTGTLVGWCLEPNVSRDLQVNKTAEPATLQQGETLTYTIRFNNRGSLPVDGVVLTDAVPAGLTGVTVAGNSGAVITQTGSNPLVWQVEELSAGEGGVITLTGVVGAGVAGNTVLTNTATISTATASEDNTGNNSSSAVVTVDTPDLQISKSDSGVDPATGVLTYTITYTNAGGTASGVVITETLPDKTSFNPSSPSGWVMGTDINEYLYSVGGMTTGATGTITFVVTVDRPLTGWVDQVLNIVAIGDDGANGPDSDTSNNFQFLTTLTPRPDLLVTKLVTPALVTAGDPITYTLTFTNQGTYPAADVVITDVMPVSLTNLSVMSSGVPITDTGASPEFTWSVGTLEAHQGGVITVTGTVSPGLTADETITNTATITTTSAETTTLNNTAAAPLAVRLADLTITKNENFDPATLNRPLTYTLTITNQGTYTASGLLVTDTLPAGLAFNRSTPAAPTCTEAGGIVTCTLPDDLPPGQNTAVVIVVTPTLTGSLSNTATVAAASPETEQSNNTAAETTTVKVPAVTVTESGGATSVLEGSLSDTYTVVLETRPSAEVTVSLTHTSRLSPSPLNLTFTPLSWNIPQTVTVSAVDDGLYQGLTSGLITHTTTSTDPDYSGIATAGVTVSILDDEVQPSVQFSTATSAADEDSGPVNLTLTLTPNPSTQDVTVSYAVTGTATAGVDFSLSGGTATIRAGDTMTNIILSVLDDFYNEPDEVVTVTLSGPGNASLGTPATRTHTILDDDTPGVTITQTGGSTDVAEGGPTDTYQVVLTSQPTGPVTVTVTTDAQTGASPGSLTFDGLSWNTAQTVTVSAVDDAVYEGNHTGLITHTVTSTDSDYHGIAAAGVTVNITDNESLPQLAVNDVAVDEAAGSAAVTVTLTGQSSFPVSVEYAVGGGTATGGGVDYSAVDGSLSWLAGETGGKSFTITVVDDALDEPDETAIVSLSNPSGATISDGSGLLTITDNDLPPVLVITKTVNTASTPARHGETVTYTIVVANQSATDAPDVSVVDNLPPGVSGTSLNQTVYISASQRLTFTLTASVAGSAPYGGSITNIASFSHVSGNGQDSAVFPVEPDTAPPAAPTLITPTGGISLANLRPTFDWDDVVDGETGVVSYTLTLTHTGVSTGYTVTESTFTPAADLAEGDYTWTVQAFDAAGNGGPSSAVSSFSLSIPKYIFLPIVIK